MSDMFKSVKPTIWIYDVECVPCAETSKRVYRLDQDMPDQEVLNKVWELNGATPEDPQPFVKTLLYKVVCISTLIRTMNDPGNINSDISLKLVTLPQGAVTSEPAILSRFLNGIGKTKPQLIGYGTTMFDINVLFQRALVNGCYIPDFCQRPSKPWDGPDYFSRSEYNVDMMYVIGGFTPNSVPKLDQICRSIKVPGKLGIDGADVANIYYGEDESKKSEILEYCETDVLSTYLLWLHTASCAGMIGTEIYEYEINLVKNLIQEKIDSEDKTSHYQKFLDEWKRLDGKEATLTNSAS